MQACIFTSVSIASRKIVLGFLGKVLLAANFVIAILKSLMRTKISEKSDFEQPQTKQKQTKLVRWGEGSVINICSNLEKI